MTRLLSFEDREPPPPSLDERVAPEWTDSDAFEGTQIFGATGSGKTTGSGAHIAVSMLKQGFGGLVLTAKKDEVTLWHRFFDAAKRPASDLIVVPGPEGRGLNLLDYELRREWVADGSSCDRGVEITSNLVSLLLASMSSGQAMVSSSEPYWDDALRELLTHAVDLCVFGQPLGNDSSPAPAVSLSDVAAVIRTAPQSIDEYESDKWLEESACAKLLRAATGRQVAGRLSRDPAREAARLLDLSGTREFWTNSFPRLSDRTRSLIVSSFTSKVALLLRSPLREVFSISLSPDLSTPPEQSFDGKVILLDLPVKEFGEAGRLAQTLYKTVWQRAAESPRRRPDQHPLFLWADESQYFVTREDALFQQTARSNRVATVYLTQNLPNYLSALGGQDSLSRVESLLGNLVTKIFHANGDPSTNEWASRLFGTYTDYQRPLPNFANRGQIHQTLLRSPSVFQHLRTGGAKNDGVIDAIVFMSGASKARPRGVNAQWSMKQFM